MSRCLFEIEIHLRVPSRPSKKGTAAPGRQRNRLFGSYDAAIHSRRWPVEIGVNKRFPTKNTNTLQSTTEYDPTRPVDVLQSRQSTNELDRRTERAPGTRGQVRRSIIGSRHPRAAPAIAG